MNQYVEQVRELLRNPPIRELQFNFHVIRLFTPQTLEKDQLGYSVGVEGEDLVTGEANMWQRSWVVIGNDEEMGDPFFVDASEDGYPVYTAMHGMGEWDPDQIAPSFDTFMELLLAFEPIARTRSYPVALEENPITDAEREQFWQKLRKVFTGEVPYFWEELIEEENEAESGD
jgi:hypothetical protein